MEEFSALLRSLLEHSVDYIKRDVDLHAVVVTGDELTQSAHMEIVLAKDSWAEQQRAIDHMVEIREMFLTDVSIDYAFAHMDDWVKATADRNRTQYVAV